MKKVVLLGGDTVALTDKTNVATNVSELVAGDYVNYVYQDESGTEQTILCRVLYDKKYNEANKSNFGIQLISINPVEKEVKLGWKVSGEPDNDEMYGGYEEIQIDLEKYRNSNMCSLARLISSDPITRKINV